MPGTPFSVRSPVADTNQQSNRLEQSLEIFARVMLKIIQGVIQQSLFSPDLLEPHIDCPSENMMRAQQLVPYYKI